MSHDSRLDPTAPSQLEGGAMVAARQVLDLQRSVATTRGTLFHALFEQITWLDDGVPERAQLRAVADKLNVTALNTDQQLDAFGQMLAMPEIAAVLCRSFYQAPREPSLLRILGPERGKKSLDVQVHNERLFAVRDQQWLLSGVIDRLVLLYDQGRPVAADVLDYKTDRVDRNDTHALDQLVDHYRPQLEAYRRAVASMYRLSAENVGARLLFVSPGTVRSL